MLIDRRGAGCLLAGLLLAACMLAGCGGKSSTTGGTTSASATSGATTRASTGGSSESSIPSTTSAVSVSAQQFIAQAEPICKQINAEIVSLGAKSGSAAEVERVVPLTTALENRGIAKLEALKPPSALAGDWRRMIGYRRTLVSLLARLLDAAKKNDGTSINPLAASKKLIHAKLTKTATANGFKECAKVGRVG